MLRIVDITAPDINNGNGIRVTLWVSGCTHKCKGCHNQWTWKFEQGRFWFIEKDKIKKELAEWLSRDYVEGLTLSGGDPLCQDREGLCEVYEIIKWIRHEFPEKNIWLYTGYYFDEIQKSDNDMMKEVANAVDVIVDGPYDETKRDIAHTPFRGSTNQNIIFLNKE